jgi:tetratricopeptide (TPR) repeat protein
VADLSLEMGKKEECAVYRKLLAGGLLEDGDAAGAEAALRESLQLNPKDIGAWQKLYDLLAERGDENALFGFGYGMARHLRKLGLVERARDQLARMIERFPAQAALRFDHADAMYALGDRTGAAEELFTLGRELIRKARFDEAERALAKALDVDRTHARAKEVYGKLRSGRIARDRARRKLILRATLAGVLLAATAVFGVYDLFVRREFALATRQVYAEGLIERGEYAEAVRRLEDVQRRHAISLLRFLEGTGIDVLKEAARRKAASGDPPAPAPAPRGPEPSKNPQRPPPRAEKP